MLGSRFVGGRLWGGPPHDKLEDAVKHWVVHEARDVGKNRVVWQWGLVAPGGPGFEAVYFTDRTGNPVELVALPVVGAFAFTVPAGRFEPEAG
jgi:hypothetical protein